MDMENRIAVLERDVHAIRAELAVIRRDHTEAKVLSGRLQQVEVDLATIKVDVVHLQKIVSQLVADVQQLKDEVGLIRIELMRLSTVQAECATKADLIDVHAKVKEVEGNIKGWMLAIALTVMSLNFGMNVVSYNAQKMTQIVTPAQEKPIVPQTIPAPATIK